MKILVFTEGTIIMHKSAENFSREERVEQSRMVGIQREEASLVYNSESDIPITPGSVLDSSNYIPIDNAVQKLTNWKKQGATICYLTSRRIKQDIEAIKDVLNRYHFPDSQDLYFRRQGEDYKDVAERIQPAPDFLIEDDCESIGGEKEMTYPHLKLKLKNKIKSIVVKEFGGVDCLPDNIYELIKYNSS